MLGIPKIRIIATGGTISRGINVNSGNEIRLNAQDIGNLIPNIDKIVKIEYEDFCQIGSSRMTPDIQLSLAKNIKKIFKNDSKLSGIVITHGTNSLEETAFLLWLTMDDPRPIILTGAMIPPLSSDSDGPRNLKNSIQIAISDKALNKGVMVCLNNEIHSARYVKKTHTRSLDSFKSGIYGLIGYVDEENVKFFNNVVKDISINTENIDTNIDIIKLSTGTRDHHVKASIESEVSGIIVEAFGLGDIPPNIMNYLLTAREKGIFVIIVSRCNDGSVENRSIWEKHGIISGGNLDSLKARILLSLIITQTKDIGKIQKYYNILSGQYD